MAQDIFNSLIIRGGLVKGENQLQLFKNIEFSMYPARAFAVTLQKIYNDQGLEYIKNLGDITGKKAADIMFNEIKRLKLLINDKYQSIEGVIELSGFGKVKFLERDGIYVIQAEDHPVIKPGFELFKEESCVCDFYAEVYSSYIRVFKETGILKISHTKCILKKGSICEWEFSR